MTSMVKPIVNYVESIKEIVDHTIVHQDFVSVV